MKIKHKTQVKLFYNIDKLNIQKIVIKGERREDKLGEGEGLTNTNYCT